MDMVLGRDVGRSKSGRRNSLLSRFEEHKRMNILQIIGLSVCLGVPVLVGIAWVSMGDSMDKWKDG